MHTWSVRIKSPEETAKLGEVLGGKCRGGEVLELISDLGGGKTTLVRSLAKGMGSTDHVSSPTFTISNVYKTDELTLYHFDFYRLSEPGIIADELAEVVDDPQAVVAVEWGEIVENVLPADRLTIRIAAIGETEREFTFTYPDKLAYLITKEA